MTFMEGQPIPKRELGSSEIEAWYPVHANALGRTLESMVIYDQASWQVYITRTARPVADRMDALGHADSTATIIHLLEWERDAQVGITKQDIVNIFSEVLGL